MTNVNIFEVVNRSKFRFPFKGMAGASVEDLWDISIENLDSVFKVLNSQLKQVNEESLLDVKTKQDEELDMKIEIVKYIVKVKQEENNLRLKAKEQKEKKQKIMEILATKQESNLQNMSEAELTKMLAELE